MSVMHIILARRHFCLSNNNKTQFPDFFYYSRRLVVLRPAVKLLPAAGDRVRGPEGGLGLSPLGARRDIGRHPAGTLTAPRERRSIVFKAVLHAQGGALLGLARSHPCVSRIHRLGLGTVGTWERVCSNVFRLLVGTFEQNKFKFKFKF